MFRFLEYVWDKRSIIRYCIQINKVTENRFSTYNQSFLGTKQLRRSPRQNTDTSMNGECVQCS